MVFQSSADIVKDILKRRLLSAGQILKGSFPSILSERSPQWLLLGDDHIFAVIFIDDVEKRQIADFQKRVSQPFPGLMTTDPTVPAAFKLQNARNSIFSNCTVENTTSFSMGPDSTIIVIDHRQVLRRTEIGDIEYRVPLGYLISFGPEITSGSVFDFFEELVAYSVSQWRSPNDG